MGSEMCIRDSSNTHRGYLPAGCWLGSTCLVKSTHQTKASTLGRKSQQPRRAGHSSCQGSVLGPFALVIMAMTEAELAAADPAFAITAPMHASQRPASRSLPRGACCRPCWTLSLTPSRALLPTPTSSLALLTVLEPRLNPTPELGQTLLDRAPLPVLAIAGARAYSALSCVCARWGGVTHPGTLVRAAALSSSSVSYTHLTLPTIYSV